MADLESVIVREVPDESAMQKLGGQIATSLASTPGTIIYLYGELGAGKTTLVRSILQTLGVTGSIKSPTYTLVEPYDLGGKTAYHLDLYRLAEPQELEFLGIRDFLSENAILLVEWPERGEGVLPPADVIIRISYAGSGRNVVIEPGEGSNHRWLQDLQGLYWSTQ